MIPHVDHAVEFFLRGLDGEAGDASELRVTVKAVAAAGIADQREEALVPEIVYPRQGVSGCVIMYSFASSSKKPYCMVTLL